MSDSLYVQTVHFKDSGGNAQGFSAWPNSVKIILGVDGVTLERRATTKAVYVENPRAYLGRETVWVPDQPSASVQIPKHDLDYSAIKEVGQKRWATTGLDLNHPWANYLDEKLADDSKYGRIHNFLQELSVDIERPGTTLTQSHIIDFLRRLVDSEKLSNFVAILPTIYEKMPGVREDAGLTIVARGIGKILEKELGFSPFIPWGNDTDPYRQAISAFPRNTSLPLQIVTVVENSAKKSVREGRAGIFDWIVAPLKSRGTIPPSLERTTGEATLALPEPARGHVNFVRQKHNLAELTT